jgi:LmbE family N-acetylglucosaminyl deacetylase
VNALLTGTCCARGAAGGSPRAADLAPPAEVPDPRPAAQVSQVLCDLAIFAAHPDDETAGAASLLLSGRRAAVVHLTDGAPRDPRLRPALPGDREACAQVRRAEALAALAEAGLGPGDVVPLGGVDQEAAASLAPLSRALADWLARAHPRVVVTHPVEGGHPDHDAAAVIARAARALARRAGARGPPLVEMTSYHLRDGGIASGVFLEGGRQVVRPLAPEEQAAKRRMLERYASQRDVLAPVGVEAERFRWARPLSITVRPHPAPLLYEVMGWSTFERFRDEVRAGLGELGLDEDALR